MFFILSSKIALFCTKQGSTMRLHRTLPQGSSLEFAAFFMNRSLASRMLVLGLPLLAFGRFLGAVTLNLTESERRYNAADVDLAERV